jgi:hypothetical protein
MHIEDGPNKQVASETILSSHLLSSLPLFFAILVTPSPPQCAMAVNLLSTDYVVEGISAVTQSDLGQSVQRGIVGGAQCVDRLDQTWH